MKNTLFAVVVAVGLQGTAFATDSQPFMNANKTAFVATTSFAALSVGSVLGATSAAGTSTWGLVSYSALALTSVAMSLAAISAWVSFGDQRSTTDAGTYLEKMTDHAAIAIAGTAQFVALTLTNALVQGVAQGTSKRVSRAIAGPDQTIKMVPR